MNDVNEPTEKPAPPWHEKPGRRHMALGTVILLVPCVVMWSDMASAHIEGSEYQPHWLLFVGWALGALIFASGLFSWVRSWAKLL